MDGRYNEHLVRDVGALNLALLVLTLGALVIGTMAVARLAALSWLAYSVPHLVYHLRHLSMPMAGTEKVALVVSLAVTVVAPLVVLWPGAACVHRTCVARRPHRAARHACSSRRFVRYRA
jgi:hypothetical protein